MDFPKKKIWFKEQLDKREHTTMSILLKQKKKTLK